MKNAKQVTLPSVVILPADLQKQIDEFFNYNGELRDIEELSWDLLTSAAMGIDNAGLDIDRFCRMMFLYRQIYLMIVLLSRYQKLNTGQPPKTE